jgi:serine/threonine protein kinase
MPGVTPRTMQRQCDNAPSMRAHEIVLGTAAFLRTYPVHSPSRLIIAQTLALTAGTRLGVYEVTAQIGAGGMGEVYRAADTNLKRSVAMKMLPASVAGDEERVARFQREAEVLGALNHPNIAAVYGLEQSNATAALVMALLAGPTLAAGSARGAIPLDEALPIAKPIAEALDAVLTTPRTT